MLLREKTVMCFAKWFLPKDARVVFSPQIQTMPYLQEILLLNRVFPVSIVVRQKTDLAVFAINSSRVPIKVPDMSFKTDGNNQI
jgi:hypothetical protein